MKPQNLFKRYFENELAKASNDESAENIHIITIIPTISKCLPNVLSLKQEIYSSLLYC